MYNSFSFFFYFSSPLLLLLLSLIFFHLHLFHVNPSRLYVKIYIIYIVFDEHARNDDMVQWLFVLVYDLAILQVCQDKDLHWKFVFFCLSFQLVIIKRSNTFITFNSL